MNATALLLTHPPSSSLQQWPLRHYPTLPPLSSLNHPNPSFPSRIICPRSSRRWDSNAETFRTQNFNFNDDEEDDDDEDTGFREKRRGGRWWSDDDEYDSSSSVVDSGFGVLEEFIDSIWILKVLGSFGWLLPFIIISFLLASGPKAFIMALALPLGQSAVSLAFDKLFGRTNSKPKYKSRTKRKPRARSARNAGKTEYEEEAGGREGTKKRKMDYQSWVAGNNNSAERSDQNMSTFRGWDELDKEREFQMGSRRRSAQTKGKSRQWEPVENGKLGRRVGKSDTPLLLRLLIAFFPFLGSWTRMF